MKELGEGSRDMIASTTGWDINPRVLGIVPKEAKVFALEGFHWVADAHYMCVPKGVCDDKLAVLLDLMSYLLTAEAQAFTYDKGYFYPGPAVKDVPLSMAPEESQDALKEFGRPEYEAMIADASDRTAAAGRRDGLRLQAVGRADRRREASGSERHEHSSPRLPRAALRSDQPRLRRAARAAGRRSLTVQRGEFVALLGPSGCGKSTALNCLAGLLPPTGGGIWLDDTRIDTLRPEERGFGMVFQNYALFPHMSVRKQYRLRPAMQRPAEGRDRAPGRRGARAGAARRRRPTSCPASSPAASSSASPSRAPSSSSRRWC